MGAAIDMGCYEYQGADGGCPADVNGDGRVDGADLAQILAQFGSKGSDLPADITGDGRVDGADLAQILVGWGLCP